MRKNLLLLILFFTCSFANSQNKWFTVYKDAGELTVDANNIINEMAIQINNAGGKVTFLPPKAIKNTTPYLIYVDIEKSLVNLPLWSEVITPQKQFFADVAGGEEKGKEVFGLFFNGFYLTHEVGHSFTLNSGKKFEDSYDSEYDANIMAMLFWRQKDSKSLSKCYDYAKEMLKKLKNPVPNGEDYKLYMTKYYDELSSDPYKYGYIQFTQFVEIYENKSLPDFLTYVKSYK